MKHMCLLSLTKQFESNSYHDDDDNMTFSKSVILFCVSSYRKVTSESVFYAHNKDLTYHYGVAEKTLDLVRKILQLLIPKENIEWSENVCELSIRVSWQFLIFSHHNRMNEDKSFKLAMNDESQTQPSDKNYIRMFVNVKLIVEKSERNPHAYHIRSRYSSLF